jgi:hypothetical protein
MLEDVEVNERAQNGALDTGQRAGFEGGVAHHGRGSIRCK